MDEPLKLRLTIKNLTRFVLSKMSLDYMMSYASIGYGGTIQMDMRRLIDHGPVCPTKSLASEINRCLKVLKVD
ncbi:hypothetical protein WSS15_30080 [Acetobacter pasteurianus]|nr:hypothetical protein WSS15_30080 [Acetobacter pasteurianus]